MTHSPLRKQADARRRASKRHAASRALIPQLRQRGLTTDPAAHQSDGAFRFGVLALKWRLQWDLEAIAGAPTITLPERKHATTSARQEASA